MMTIDSICGQVLKDTDEGAIYLSYDRKTNELYAGYMAGNSGISKNWAMPYDPTSSLDEQLATLNEMVDDDLTRGNNM